MIGICLVIGYLFGCIETGYIVGKLNHVDIRNYGSGNSGTTNALRTLGWKAGAITFLGDVLKAIVACLLVRFVLYPDMESTSLLTLYTGLGVVLGHNYPFWLGGKGGKGIAATGGIMLAFDIRMVPIALAIFVISVALTRYVSLGSLLVSVFFPIWVAIMYPGDYHMLIVSVLFTILAFIKHRANINRLLHGTENKIGQRVKVNDEVHKIKEV